MTQIKKPIATKQGDGRTAFWFEFRAILAFFLISFISVDQW